jgi:tetratricopeptide (TPR) repeat protein
LLLAVLVLLAHTATRRSMAMISLLLLVAGGSAQAQGPRNRGDDAWRGGDYERAAALYLEQVRAGVGGDTTLFNLGTAALAAGDTAVARRALEQVGESLEPELRFLALYNLGVLRLRLAEADSGNAAVHLEAARTHYREALMLRPQSRAAKWNLELAVRSLPPAGAQGPPPPGESESPPPPDELPPEGLSAAQAQQILNSMAEEERRTRYRQNRRRQQVRETRGRKEW